MQEGGCACVSGAECSFSPRRTPDACRTGLLGAVEISVFSVELPEPGDLWGQAIGVGIWPRWHLDAFHSWQGAGRGKSSPI